MAPFTKAANNAMPARTITAVSSEGISFSNYRQAVAWRPEFLLNIGVDTHKFGLNNETAVKTWPAAKNCIDAVLIGAAVMSALGQKQTYAVQNGMSALPPKADIRQRKSECPPRVSQTIGPLTLGASFGAV